LGKKRGSDDKHHFPKFPYAPLKAIRRTHEYNNIFSNSFQSLVLPLGKRDFLLRKEVIRVIKQNRLFLNVDKYNKK